MYIDMDSILFYIALISLLISVIISLSIVVEVYGFTGTELVDMIGNITSMPFP